MSNFDNLNSLMTGHNPHKELLKQTRKLVEKWEPTGLLDEIDDSTKKQGMAVLLENQATQLKRQVLVVIKKNGLVLHFHWSVGFLVSCQRKSLLVYNR